MKVWMRANGRDFGNVEMKEIPANGDVIMTETGDGDLEGWRVKSRAWKLVGARLELHSVFVQRDVTL